MQTDLLENAAKVINNPQILVNMISRRVRQLSQGQRALVNVQPRMGLSDIALAEVIAGKLTYEHATGEVAFPRVPQLAVFTPAKLAA